MNRSINPIVHSVVEYFRQKGRLGAGESATLSPERSASVSQEINDSFRRFSREDNGPSDIDLRWGHITKQGPDRVVTVSKVGNLREGQLESQTLFPSLQTASGPSLPLTSWPGHSIEVCSRPLSDDGFENRKEAGASMQETELILAKETEIDQLKVVWSDQMAVFKAFRLDKLDPTKNQVTTWNLQELADPCLSNSWPELQQFIVEGGTKQV